MSANFLNKASETLPIGNKGLDIVDNKNPLPDILSDSGF